MARQYKRAYELTIVPESGEARVIKELRISFEITKTLLSFPNLAKIIIYNPSPDTVESLTKKYTKISLNLGYEGNIKLVFTGQVRNVFESKTNVDRMITVYAGDGERSYQTSIFNKTFAETVSINTAITEVMNSFKELNLGEIAGLPTTKDKLRGQTLSGSSKDIMDSFAKEYGFNWSIQDGEIVVVPIDEPLTSQQAVLITPVTGLIGSPTITEIGADVTTYLNPELIPNVAFKIESASSEVQLGNIFFRNVSKTSAEGFYKVLEVVFKGDSREGDWVSSVKGRTLNV